MSQIEEVSVVDDLNRILESEGAETDPEKTIGVLCKGNRARIASVLCRIAIRFSEIVGEVTEAMTLNFIVQKATYYRKEAA
jgi:hypothetical protein